MVATSQLVLTPQQLERYTDRIGLDPRDAPADLDTLQAIHLAHLERIPFENLDIVFGDGVPHDQLLTFDKVVGDGRSSRGGWCFELNGVMALLLESLGYHVRLLGAAVLLDGPTQVIDHLLLEVDSPSMTPHLADVGFGDSFDFPLSLNTAGPQESGSGVFQLIGSPQGTTLTRHIDGVPAALMRFKRVAHTFHDFAPAAASMQIDPTKKWATHPICTRRLSNDELDEVSHDGPPGTQRVTLSRESLKITRAGSVDEQPVAPGEWGAALDEWFSIAAPGSSVVGLQD